MMAMTTFRAMAMTIGDGSSTYEVDLPVAEPGPTEIRVAVHAAGVNPVDWKSRATGGFGGWGEHPVDGWDVSGVVEAVGAGVTIWQPGDEVFGMPLFPAPAGAYAESVVAPARQFARKPAGLSHVEAAALPLAGLTAWQALVDTAGVGAGDRVLIHAAAGGVGHLAVQIAHARGATVIGTASAGKHELLRSLGVDQVVDYRSERFEDVVEPVDVVVDLVGTYGERSLDVLRDGGRLIVIPSPGDLSAFASAAQARGITAQWMLVEPDGAGLAALAALVEGGALKPIVAETFPLAEVDAAHESGRAGRTTGKIVLVVRAG